MTKSFTPQKEKHNYTYKASEVTGYIFAAYGEEIPKHKVTLGLSCGQKTVEKLGYKHEEDDGWFPPDPRIDKSYLKILGEYFVDEGGGVGMVAEVSENGDFSSNKVIGFKEPHKVAWWTPKEVKFLGKDLEKIKKEVN